MKIFEHLTQLDNAVGFYRKGIIAILIVCAIFMTAMYIHTETRILQATSSAYILNQDGDVAIEPGLGPPSSARSRQKPMYGSSSCCSSTSTNTPMSNA